MSDSYKMCVVAELFLRISLVLGRGLFILAFPYASSIFLFPAVQQWTVVTALDLLHVWGWHYSALQSKVWHLHWCSLACVWDLLLLWWPSVPTTCKFLWRPPVFGVAVGWLTWSWALLCPQQGHLCKLWVFPVPPRVVTVTTCYSNLWKDRCKLNIGGLMLQVENQKFPPLFLIRLFISENL